MQCIVRDERAEGSRRSMLYRLCFFSRNAHKIISLPFHRRSDDKISHNEETNPFHPLASNEPSKTLARFTLCHSCFDTWRRHPPEIKGDDISSTSIDHDGVESSNSRLLSCLGCSWCQSRGNRTRLRGVTAADHSLFYEVPDKHAHPQNFERLQLHFTKSMFDAKNANLEPRFNMCFEVSAEAELSRASTCAAPSDKDVFGVMLCSESIDYLVEHVREVNPKSIFVATVELSAQRLNIDKKRPGGMVKAPTFYIAFVSRDAHCQPTQEEIKECKKHAHKLIEENGCGTSGAGCHVFGTNCCHQSAQRGTNDRVGRTTSRGKMNVCGEQNAECRPEFSRCLYRNLVSSCMHVLFQLETAAIPRVGLLSVSAECVVDCSPSFFL
jgi:hypothetical protein